MQANILQSNWQAVGSLCPKMRLRRQACCAIDSSSHDLNRFCDTPVADKTERKCGGEIIRSAWQRPGHHLMIRTSTGQKDELCQIDGFIVKGQSLIHHHRALDKQPVAASTLTASFVNDNKCTWGQGGDGRQGGLNQLPPLWSAQ
eukprot:scaffold438737_cov31-Prasinocladus_malaysianus.AAC.1